MSETNATLTRRQMEIVDFVRHQLGIDLSSHAGRFGSNRWFNVDTCDPAIRNNLRRIESLGLISGRYRIERNGCLGHAFYPTSEQ